MEIRAEVRAQGTLAEGKSLEGVRRSVWVHIVRAASALQGAVVAATPVGVSSALRGAWQVVYDEPALTARVVNNMEYALPVELGRRASMPPVAPIRLWVVRKLGLSGDEAESAAWGIAKKKARTATPGQHFVERTWDVAMPIIEREEFGDGLTLTIVKNLEG